MSAVDNRYQGALQRGIAALNLTVSAEAQAQLLAYHGLLVKWNKAYNLTAVRDPQEMIERHLLDSLSIASFISGERWADIGSGGGMPGIVLAILAPERQFTLVDSNGKKTRFLQQVKMELGLGNVTVLHSRVEQLELPAFDGIVSRAFSSLHDFTNWTRHLGDNQTQWLAMKGLYPQDELAALPDDFHLTDSHALDVPGCQGQRHLLILQRKD
ncbi:16S rRNA (guanine(527)-N(7))-methyltransferase RsmG [Atopomonas sediminilitoris]|uniref:16S rRNA (guanine(527)-N(7))-methyltransferase RsmG n=1 Tax=Atopomonas sediminilitoris TaxID=2919919 RepID=UPI001F4E2306|nr:16S rRNA (guanine(527)-N(7))-methyltransferase RsmG [Atopomonas sediminilitoris]MCJ8169435.1 16S rRNA (guanine(527)-N(7))-methyltransferase RsmG [Atopomonas sediminilitoris]